ncbi:MAG: SHOCT domain-containing protein [Oscillospiraceae bacterium]|nr:SHOCT domain-containing protein [Oscillospiraceae bacterium]
MDNQASMYSEKKLAYFETVYRESKLSKPQDVNITVTANHIYGVAYICEQQGIIEEDPVYSRFSCGLEEITKIYINNNNKMNPIYVQCDDTSKNVINRKRIILPCFPDNDAIIKVINEAKAEVDEKLEKQREMEKNQKIKQLEARRRAQDDEFESLTSGWNEIKAEKPAPKVESKPAPAPAPKAEPKPAPAPAPKAEPKPAPAPAPKAEPKPAPAPAPQVEPAPSAVSVEDILGLDDILGIKHEAPSAAPVAAMEVVDEIPDEQAIEAIPEAVVQKDPDEIEAVEIPAEIPDPTPKAEPVKEKPAQTIEEIDTAAEIARKLTPKAAPKRTAAPKEEKVEVKPEPKREINVISDDVAEHMTLDDFETAVKKLKAMFDNGMISEGEFAAEKKKLLKHLY